MIIYFINIIHECELFKLPWQNCHNIVCTASNENSPPTNPRSIYCTVQFALPAMKILLGPIIKNWTV